MASRPWNDLGYWTIEHQSFLNDSGRVRHNAFHCSILHHGIPHYGALRCDIFRHDCLHHNLYLQNPVDQSLADTGTAGVLRCGGSQFSFGYRPKVLISRILASVVHHYGSHIHIPEAHSMDPLGAPTARCDSNDVPLLVDPDVVRDAGMGDAN